MLQFERFEHFDPHQDSTLRKLGAMTGNRLEVHDLPLAIVHKQLTIYQLDLVLKRLLPMWIALRNLVAFLCKSLCFLQITVTPDHARKQAILGSKNACAKMVAAQVCTRNPVCKCKRNVCKHSNQCSMVYAKIEVQQQQGERCSTCRSAQAMPSSDCAASCAAIACQALTLL